MLLDCHLCELVQEYVQEQDQYQAQKQAFDHPVLSLQLRTVTLQTNQHEKRILFSHVRALLREWEKIAEDRLQNCKNELPKDCKRIFTDENVKGSYSLMSIRIDEELKEFDKPSKHRRSLLIVTDSSQRIQAIATTVEKRASFYVESLVSAPWNSRMFGKNAPEHEAIRVKGTATAVMRYIYEQAQVKGKSKVLLQPTLSSRSFYADKLQMSFNTRAAEFSFQVTETLPDSLKSALQLQSSSQ